VFEQQKIERDLRVALTLKADDLWFTIGGERGRQFQAEFLGVEPFDGIASEFFDEDGLARIDLSRFAIAGQVAELAEAVVKRSWGPKAGVPDTEDLRNYNLDFFEHFLSTLPTVALGGEDTTSVGRGILRDLYLTSYAWFGLVDSVADAFRDHPHLYSVELSDLARLSGRDLRTIRNQSGPSRALRTTAERHLRREGPIRDPAFVTVNTFDAVDWLRRRGFEFQPLALQWAGERIPEAPDAATRARGFLMLALVNLGPRPIIASVLACSEDRVRSIEEGAEPLAEADEQRLREALDF
jgi:hypothetical protein